MAILAAWQHLAASCSFWQVAVVSSLQLPAAAPVSSWQLILQFLAAPGFLAQLLFRGLAVLAASGNRWQQLAAPGSPYTDAAASRADFCVL